MLYKNIIASLLLIIALTFSVSFTKQLQIQRQYKLDFTELNHIQYGLLNAQQWTDKISTIVAKKINEFEFTAQKREQTRALIEKTLALLFDEAQTKIRERNLDNKKGWDFIAGGIKQLLIENLVGIDKLKKDIPNFAESLLTELEKPENKKHLIKVIKQQLNMFREQSFSHIDLQNYQSVLKKYQCRQRLNCNAILQQKIQQTQTQLNQELWIIISCLFVFNILLLTDAKCVSMYPMGLLLSGCLLFLVLGVATPMIEIEAKISQLEFQLLNEMVNFSEQIVYYQNKSIFDVVLLLMQNKQFEVVFVGVLILIFSILFPLLKLCSSVMYCFMTENKNAFIEFFALKSGKWSMADVWVVALFMAYLGFDGLISSQLSQLEQSSQHIKVLTTNGTQLEGGFYLFLSFCLSSLFLSARIEKSDSN